MTRKAPEPQTARHVMIFDRDWELMELHFSRRFDPNQPGTGTVVRTLVHRFCNRIRAREALARDGAAKPLHEGETQGLMEDQEGE